MSIRENYLTIRENMEKAAAMAGRDVNTVKLIAVTKFVEEARISEALDCGVTAVGENRVQELTGKLEFFRTRGAEVNLIGQLQTNKVKYIIGKVDMIQSVDRLALAQEIDRLAARAGVVQDVMIEVNIGGEASKSGVSPDGLEPLLAHAALCPGLRVKGLMTIPPAVSAGEENRWYFRQMYELFVDIRRKTYDNVTMAELSMGMSGDYEEAVRCGATIVRLGTALFGPRNYDLQEAPPYGTIG